MRITKKIFSDLAIYMVALGVLVGALFPFFVMLFGVPRATAFRPVFYASCIAAGILLALMNIILARKVVGTRIRQLSKQMKHVEGLLARQKTQRSTQICSPGTCTIAVNSEDELGESAESFNHLIMTLSEVLLSQADLQSFSEMLTSHLELEVLSNEMLRHMVKATHASGGAIVAEHGGELVATASLAMKNVDALAENELIHHAAKLSERQIIRFPEDIVLDGVIAEFQPRELIIEPILYKQVLLGVIALGSAAPFSSDDLDKLSLYGPILSMAFHNAITHQQMQRLAALDPMTEIYNRRFGLNRAQEEFSRAIRNNTALSLIMMDIDHFKNVNDTYGHMIGDKIIIQIIKTALGVIREGDFLIRYGGEEFLCVLPGASQHDALHVAERIRVMVKDSVLKNGDQEVKVTLSLGIAAYPNREISDIQQFINLADGAMYTAKNGGRNCVVAV